MPQPPNTASDDPSTTNSKSSVRRVNWNRWRLGGGAAGCGSGVVMGLLECRQHGVAVFRQYTPIPRLLTIGRQEGLAWRGNHPLRCRIAL